MVYLRGRNRAARRRHFLMIILSSWLWDSSMRGCVFSSSSTYLTHCHLSTRKPELGRANAVRLQAPRRPFNLHRGVQPEESKRGPGKVRGRKQVPRLLAWVTGCQINLRASGMPGTPGASILREDVESYFCIKQVQIMLQSELQISNECSR